MDRKRYLANEKEKKKGSHRNGERKGGEKRKGDKDEKGEKGKRDFAADY